MVNSKNDLIIWLGILAVLDVIIPIPLTGLVLIYGVLQRPAWFTDIVSKISSGIF